MNNETKNSRAKVKNTVAAKKGTFATITTVIFIVVTILVNILATAVAEKFPLDIDLTADQLHTLSAENIKYVQSIDKEVSIYVLLTEQQYTDGQTLDYYAAMAYAVDNSTNTTATYYQQTVDFLKAYTKINDNIKLEFLDVTSPATEALVQEYSGFDKYYGDLLVRCQWKDANGDLVVRRAVVPYNEIYTLTDTTGMASYGYAGYTITANNIENKLSSAIYRVTSENTPVYFVPSSYCDTYYSDQLAETLKDNNYDVEKVDGLLTNADLSKYTGMILTAPKGDFNKEELEVLDKFLDNDGKKGKNVLIFGNVNVLSYPNLTEFLGEWGISFMDGVLYDDTNGYYIPNLGNNTLFLKSTGSDYTKIADGTQKYYVGTNIIPLKQEYETYSNRTSKIILSAHPTATIAPVGYDDTWTISKDAVRDSYPVGIVTYEDELVYDEDGTAKAASSHVAVLSTANFLDESWLSYSSVGNLNLALDLVNSITGQDSGDFTFVAKKVTSEDYSDKVTEASVTTIRVIFMIALPVILVGCGIFVWIRRKNA